MSEFVNINRRGGSQTSLDGRRGFVLPTVLMLMMVLSTLTVFVLISSSDQQRAGRAMRESVRSFYAADAGVNAVMAQWDALGYGTLLTTPGDSADLGWQTLENGARYRAVFVRVDGGSSGAAIHSLRVVGQGAGSFAGSTTIFREIHPTFSGIDATIKGGLGGEELELDFDGDGGVSVSGLDTIPSQWASENICDPLEDKPGAVWQDTMNVDVSAVSDLDGAPRLVEDAAMNAADLMVFGDYTYDDLVAMADITIIDGDMRDGIGPVVLGSECKTWGIGAEFNWGDPYDPSSPCFDYFPIIHLTDDVRIRDVGGFGQGIMLVDNELEIEDMDPETWEFFGIIIQKGPGAEGMEFEEQGVKLYGALIAGGEVEIEDGATMRYSQCAVDRALKAHGLIGAPVSERVWRQAID